MEESSEGSKDQEQMANWAEDFDKSLEKVKPSSVSLKDRLEKLPAVVRAREFEVYEASCDISNVKKAVELINSRMMAEITSETVALDEDKPAEERKPPKPKYTNEAARNAELRQRQSHDKEYLDVKAREEAVHRRFEYSKIEFGFAKRFLNASHRLVELMAIEQSQVIEH